MRSSTPTRSARRRSPSEGSELTFHTTVQLAGRYRLFVQVRVDGFVHTVPLTLTVT